MCISNNMALFLEDCGLEVKKTSLKYITLSLPSEISLTGIKSRINNYQVGHENLENKFGNLYVACDFAARYSPAEEELRPSRVGIFLHGTHRMGFRYQDFTLEGSGIYTLDIRPESNSEEIIEKIQESKDCDAFVESFINWINEMKRLHGDMFFEG